MSDNSVTMVAELKARLCDLPYISAELPGIGGHIKAEPEHFVVEEVLPYAACGQGEHVFITLRRSGWNTADVGRALGHALKVKDVDIGWGGRKDKQAVTTQTFSVRMPLDLPLARIEPVLSELPFEILAVERHQNKLKTGHVAGNRFSILLSQVSPQTLAQAQAIAAVLSQKGVPNYFGEQRFGIEMRNLDRAAALFNQKRPPRGKSVDFMVSALQSALFNCWLTDRIRDGLFHCIIEGDVAQKTDTGGMFIVDDPQEANERFSRDEILFTGPVFGFKMKPAAGFAAEREIKLLQTFGLDTAAFKPLRAPGTRRAGLISMKDMVLQAVPQGIAFTFSLPAGAYATTVMREFMRTPLP